LRALFVHADLGTLIHHNGKAGKAGKVSGLAGQKLVFLWAILIGLRSKPSPRTPLTLLQGSSRGQ
jgi:hypothetical protein